MSRGSRPRSVAGLRVNLGRLRRVATVFAGSAALLLASAGNGFANGSGDVSIAGASASVAVQQIGFTGNGAEIDASNIQVTGSGCYYVKYTLWVQGGFDQHGKHLGDDFCYGGDTTSQSKNAWASALGMAPWAERVTVWVCQDVPDATDPCGQSIDIDAGGHNDMRP